jgi:hypothetical protein
VTSDRSIGDIALDCVGNDVVFEGAPMWDVILVCVGFMRFRAVSCCHRDGDPIRQDNAEDCVVACGNSCGH